MYEYESKELDREKLEYLRKNTFLGPIAMFKIARAKKQVDDFRKWYQQREGELLEADYTIAEVFMNLQKWLWNKIWIEV